MDIIRKNELCKEEFMNIVNNYIDKLKMLNWCDSINRIERYMEDNKRNMNNCKNLMYGIYLKTINNFIIINL
jgi:hypothetical protein